MASAYFRPNKAGRALKASGKRMVQRAPEYGTWWLRYRDAAGQLVRERTRASYREEAEKLAQQKALRAEKVAAGVADPEVVPMSCAELLRRYLEAHAHLASQAPMRSQVKVWFGPHFGRLPVVEVTPARCEELLGKARAAGQSPATVRQLHIRGRLLFKYAQRMGACRDNPWERVPRPSVPVKKPRFLSREQVGRLLESAGKYRLLLLMAVLSGLRRGELVGLQWEDVAQAMVEGKPRLVLMVRRSHGRATTKSGKERAVPVHPALAVELEAARKVAPEGEAYVFPAPEGGRRGESWHTAKLVHRIARRAGVQLPEGFTFHDLRKTFLTHLLHDSGGNIGAGQKLAGHSTPAVTSTYYLGEDVDFLTSAVDSLKLVGSLAAEHTASTPRLRVVASNPRSPRKKE